MIELILAVSVASLIASAALLRAAWLLRKQARETERDAQSTYDYAVGLIRESTEAYREATKEVERASRLNRETYAYMSGAIEESSFIRGSRRLN
jgi:DNA primase large subunit